MWIERVACATVLLSATIAAGCGSNRTAAETADASSPSSSGRAGTLSVTAFRFTGWHDDSFHYLPALSVAAPSTSRPVFVQRVDFTAEDAGARRLLKGVRYAAAQRVPPGGAVDLVTDANSADLPEIASPVALTSVTAIVYFSDDEGQTGIVSASASTPTLPHGNPVGSLALRDFTVEGRRRNSAFSIGPGSRSSRPRGRVPR